MGTISPNPIHPRFPLADTYSRAADEQDKGLEAVSLMLFGVVGQVVNASDLTEGPSARGDGHPRTLTLGTDGAHGL